MATVTLKKIVSDVINIASSGSNPTDFKISYNQIAYWAIQLRATFIAQQINKRKDYSNTWVQTISCMDLEQIDKSDCCEVTTGCTILRTVLPVPSTIETYGDTMIIRVTDAMGNVIPKTNYMEVVYNSNSKYAFKKPKWFERNNRIYIVNNDFLTKINVDLIVENPQDLADYVNCNGVSCYSDDDNFPCSLAMAAQITDTIIKTKVNPFLTLPQDTTNNANQQPDLQTK